MTIRDRMHTCRELRHIKNESDNLRIGIKALSNRYGCKFNTEDTDGGYGNALHWLIGKKNINGIGPDCVDCEIKTYRTDSDSYVTIRAFKLRETTCTFDESSQFEAIRRTVFVALERCPDGDYRICQLTSMDIANKEGPIYKHVKKCWEFARAKLISDKPDVESQLAMIKANAKDTNLPEEYSHPLFSGNVPQRFTRSKATPSDYMFVLNRKSSKNNFQGLFRMKQEYLKTISHVEFIENNFQPIDMI